MKPTHLWLMRGGKPRGARSNQTPDFEAQTCEGGLEEDAETPSSEAQALWQRARLSTQERLAASLPAVHSHSRETGSLQANSRETDSRETDSLQTLSDAVHGELTAREEAILPPMAPSFATIHSRLMQAISASQELPAPSGSDASSNEGSGHRAEGVRRRWLQAETRSKTRFASGGAPRSFARRWAFSWCAASFVAVAAGAGGHHLGRLNSYRLPADTMISDFDGSLKSSAPLPLLGQNSRAAASWLGRNTGIKVSLPAPGKSGVRLIGARFTETRSRATGSQPIAQTHYERRGVRLALYQMHAPDIGLDGLDQQIVRGRSFFVHSAGAYRLVAWRNGENVMAVVSPLDAIEAVRLADEMRDDEHDNEVEG